jgi:hypothetical protein
LIRVWAVHQVGRLLAEASQTNLFR